MGQISHPGDRALIYRAEIPHMTITENGTLLGKIEYIDMDERLDWAKDNLRGKFTWQRAKLTTLEWLFEHEDDAALFRLRWR
jgi:hypothetical protein